MFGDWDNETSGPLEDHPFVKAEKILFALQICSFVFYIVVIYPMLRYPNAFLNAHYFFKAAVQLAFMNLVGLLLCCFHESCDLFGWICLGQTSRAMVFFVTEVMMLIIAMNRFSIVVLHNYYDVMFNSKLAVWLFLVPIFLSLLLFVPRYFCSELNETCIHYFLLAAIHGILTIIITASILILYVAVFVCKRCANLNNQLNKNRFLYQAAIDGIFLVFINVFWFYKNLNDPLNDLIYDYLITSHFSAPPIAYLCFQKKLRRTVRYCLSCGKFDIEDAVHVIVPTTNQTVCESSNL